MISAFRWKMNSWIWGGEPTLRKDLVEIIQGLRRISGIRDIGITSNGIVLRRKLPQLVEAGLTHLNLSLDTLHVSDLVLFFIWSQKYFNNWLARTDRINGDPAIRVLLGKSSLIFLLNFCTFRIADRSTSVLITGGEILVRLTTPGRIRQGLVVVGSRWATVSSCQTQLRRYARTQRWWSRGLCRAH